MPDDLPQPPAEPMGPAQSAYARIAQYIRAFEAQLNSAQEVAMGFAGSEAGVLRIEGIGFFDPDLITFYGRDEAGQKTQLIQHVSQLSVLLRAAPRRGYIRPRAAHWLCAASRLAGRRGGRRVGLGVCAPPATRR